jgi:L-seryl-tRNA(Ser) seleniumtransferase
MDPQAQPAAESALRQIPSVDELLRSPRLERLMFRAGRELVLETTREVLDDLRAELAADPGRTVEPLDPARIEDRIQAAVDRQLEPSLRPVINATGVVLHTNLGRAPISPEAAEHLRRTATSYSNLEYDLASGRRGKRDTHTARLLTRITSAEAAIVVNNNAAAIFLVLHTLARGGEVLVSRGELVEIGDGFRIPEILHQSGAVLREVGTTNRTRVADYEGAINERTRMILRVHPSNFRIVGFTERPALDDLVDLGRRANLPVVEDLGSGCLADLLAYGVEEPVVRTSLGMGVSLVTFSGDKLLGGPQAGIIAGDESLVGRVRRNPLFRALRVDKLVVAALETTLLAYLKGAHEEIPALRMIQLSMGELELRAQTFAERLRRTLPAGAANIEVGNGYSVVGGGATPGEQLPTRLVAISAEGRHAAELEARLRSPAEGPAVVARVEDDRLLLDLRTVFPDDEAALARAVAAALLS